MEQQVLKYFRPQEIAGAAFLLDCASPAMRYLSSHPSATTGEVARGIGKNTVQVTMMLTELTIIGVARMDAKDKGTPRNPRYALVEDYEERLREITMAVMRSAEPLHSKYARTYKDEIKEMGKLLTEDLEKMRVKALARNAAKARGHMPTSTEARKR